MKELFTAKVGILGIKQNIVSCHGCFWLNWANLPFRPVAMQVQMSHVFFPAQIDLNSE